METWTWAANSVRPYESLWIMTERFLWLNAISAQTLAREIGFPAWPRMDLITADGGFHNKNMQQARTRLIQLLSLTRAQTRHGTVKASLTVELNKLRVCPECLRMAYHAAIFQSSVSFKSANLVTRSSSTRWHSRFALAAICRVKPISRDGTDTSLASIWRLGSENSAPSTVCLTSASLFDLNGRNGAPAQQRAISP